MRIEGLLNIGCTMSTTRNLYEVLGVEKNASQQQIKQAYRQLAMKVSVISLLLHDLIRIKSSKNDLYFTLLRFTLIVSVILIKKKLTENLAKYRRHTRSSVMKKNDAYTTMTLTMKS